MQCLKDAGIKVWNVLLGSISLIVGDFLLIGAGTELWFSDQNSKGNAELGKAGEETDFQQGRVDFSEGWISSLISRGNWFWIWNLGR